MNFHHITVLLDEAVENLALKKEGTYVDGTLGGAGHSEEILKRLGPGGRLVGIDRDKSALEAAKVRLEAYKDKLFLVHSNFSRMRTALQQNGILGVDGVILDLGVSSPQLDESSRGFSYMQDAQLDMRMDRESIVTAEDIVNEYSGEELTDIIRDYGEEKWASRIAEFIVRERDKNRITTTSELVEIIKKAIPASARREGPHPAKRTFQAIRIAVNRELDELREVIPEIVDILNPGGRICIITFHSLEDRIVKESFKKMANPCTCPPQFPICTCNNKPKITLISKKPILPSEEEISRNPRARSAKLRVAQKL
jgi:16S rRNA (cytosine1402-N4)-methyltransferase